MTNESPTLQDLLERDKDKLGEIAALRESGKVDPEWLVLAEFGSFYGWESVQAIRNNEMDADTMNNMLLASRKILAQKRYNSMVDTYLAFAATQGKQGVKAFKEHIREMIKQWR